MCIRKLLSICILLIGLFITGCENVDLEDLSKLPFDMPNKEENNSYINQEGLTIKDSYLPIEGYTRIEHEEGSFAEFLRNQKLKPYGEKVLYYVGRKKP